MRPRTRRGGYNRVRDLARMVRFDHLLERVVLAAVCQRENSETAGQRLLGFGV